MNLRFASAIIVPALCLLLNPVFGAPLINEFLADNVANLADVDGEFTDWIEIHNPDGVPVNLDGYHLTDDPVDRPTRWTFPAVSIPAGGYLVVFASGKDRAVTGQELHTNFGLSNNGEDISLLVPGGSVVVHQYLDFPTQTPDRSYGLLNGTATFFNTPTPGAANAGTSAPAEAVQFSVSSKTFSAPIALTLSVASPTATIRYTTNRSVPTAASALYDGTPIAISATTRVRARAFEPGRPDGPVASETYLQLAAVGAPNVQSTIPFVVIHKWDVGTPANDTTHQTALLIFEPGSPGGVSDVTAAPVIAVPGTIERRGSSTAGDPKFSMAVEARDENELDRNISPLGMPAEADWILHAPYSFDRSLMHNDLIYQLSRDAGRWASRTRFVEVYLNTDDAVLEQSDYFGVYSFQEKIDRDEKRVDVQELLPTDNTEPRITGGYILKIDRLDGNDNPFTMSNGQQIGFVYPQGVATSPDQTAVTAQQKTWITNYMNAMWAALNAPDFYDPVNGYSKYIDPDAAVDHLILNVAAKNVDALRLSAYMFKRRGGRLEPGPIWDFDRAEGSTDGRDLNPVTWRGDNSDLGTDFFHYPWYNEMFIDSNFWQRWIDRLHELRLGPLSTAYVHAVIDQMAAVVAPPGVPLAQTPVQRNITRWGTSPRGASPTTPGTNGTYAGEIQWLKNWWQSRLNFMDGQFTRPAVASLADGPVPIGSTTALTSPSTARPGVKIYYTTDGSDPRLFDTTHGQPVATVTLLAENTAARATVPNLQMDTQIGTTWRGLNEPFDDSTWTSGTQGVGYDNNAAGVNYVPFINIRWSTPTFPVAGTNNTMFGVNATCYIRIPFTATAENIQDLGFMRLEARYDDGFVAFLNGQQIASRLQPATLAWNSLATGTHDDGAAVSYEPIDVTAHINRLQVGPNVLAIHAMNGGSNTSSDLLMQFKLVGGPTPDSGGPEISPQAIEYTGEITLNQPTQLFVRTYDPATPSDPPTQGGGGTGSVPNGSRFSAPTRLFYFPGANAAAATNLQISEVLYHPSPPTLVEQAAGHTNSNNFEFIRLTNTGGTPIDLTGINFTNGLDFTSEPSLQNLLLPGTSVVVVENLDGFTSRYGTTFRVLGEYQGELDDGGEHIVLNAKDGTVIADFIYGDSSPWPDRADDGYSLVYQGGEPNDPNDWEASTDPGGSGVSTYGTWKLRYFDAAGTPLADQAPDADADGDGVINILEYASATNPLDKSDLATVSPASPGTTSGLTLRRRAGTTDLAFVFQHSSDLTSWLPGGAPATVVPNGDGTETVTWRIAPPDPLRQFMRVRVTGP
ncbi:MAG: CotH kinase family protein [Verrucomicrobiales bacterium]